MSVRRLAAAALVLTALSAPAARAQEPRLARLPEPTRRDVQALLDSARATGLPIEPLVDRALEGAAKGAAGTLIVDAVRRLTTDLSASRDALGSGVSDAEVAAGASALRAGARAEDLAKLRALRPGQPVAVAAAVLADLVALGVPPDTATAAVLALADKAKDSEYLAFRRNVERDVALGATPVAALTLEFATQADAFNSGGVPGSSRPRKP